MSRTATVPSLRIRRLPCLEGNLVHLIVHLNAASLMTSHACENVPVGTEPSHFHRSSDLNKQVTCMRCCRAFARAPSDKRATDLREDSPDGGNWMTLQVRADIALARDVASQKKCWCLDGIPSTYDGRCDNLQLPDAAVRSLHLCADAMCLPLSKTAQRISCSITTARSRCMRLPKMSWHLL